jgi:tellurite methyltransferase
MDKSYWEAFYQIQNENMKPSLFAKAVRENYVRPTQSLIELGCGNGRDAVFFANEGIMVTAIDQCENEIKFLTTRYKHLSNCVFHSNDFSSLNDFETPFDIVYSRFTLHSVSKEQEQQTLSWSHRNMEVGGLLCIEVRGQKNEIYKLGEKVEGETDAYIYNDHYRRFLNFDNLCADIQSLGFQVIFSAEEKGFAPFDGQNETYIRVIARKI